MSGEKVSLLMDGLPPPLDPSVTKPIVKLLVNQQHVFKTVAEKCDGFDHLECKYCQEKFSSDSQFQDHLLEETHKLRHLYRTNKKSLLNSQYKLTVCVNEDGKSLENVIVRPGTAGSARVNVANCSEEMKMLTDAIPLIIHSKVKVDCPHFPVEIKPDQNFVGNALLFDRPPGHGKEEVITSFKESDVINNHSVLGDTLHLSIVYCFEDSGAYMYPVLLKIQSQTSSEPVYVLKELVFRCQSEFVDDLKPISEYKYPIPPKLRVSEGPIIPGVPPSSMKSSLVMVRRLDNYYIPPYLDKVLNNGLKLHPKMSSAEFLKEAKLPKTKPVETLKRAACDPFLKCKLAFCKTIADECQPFLQRFQTSKPMTPYLFEAVEKLLRYLMNRCVKPDLMKCTGPKLLSIDTKKSENLILSKNIDIGFATKRLLGETAITVTERQKLEFIHECRSMLTTMIAKLQEKSPLKQKAVRGLSSLDPCVIQHSPQLAQKRFSFLLEELNHANIINDVLAENAKKEYLHFCNLKKSELQEIFRPCDQFSDEVGLDTIYGSFLIGEANYKHLWEVIKICLVLSHGNATVEGGFSVNKSLLVENMHEKTVIAQRHIHDEIQEAGGIKNIHISKKMLDYVRGARKRYHEYLEMKKQEKSEKDKKKAEKRKLDIQVKDLEGERKKLMMATEEKREAIDVELQELKKKQASLY
uniref:C2H2-type domain-containing protein n=1 Tax=Timema monikensis TaxID=170555 RepID=A0A7R9EB29_9NEOP|nr:unnamed protein product [Timema monikensis]